MKNGKLDRINLLKYLMVVLLIIYVVFLVTREGDNTVSVDTIEKEYHKSRKIRRNEKRHNTGSEKILQSECQ